jgi:hypothetical protein
MNSSQYYNTSIEINNKYVHNVRFRRVLISIFQYLSLCLFIQNEQKKSMDLRVSLNRLDQV